MKKYTIKETTELKRLYRQNVDIEYIAVVLARSKYSIIGKLSKLGIYKPEGYKTKRGQDVKFRTEYVKDIEEILGVKLPGLHNSYKDTLAILHKHIVDMDSLIIQLLNVEFSEDTRIREDSYPGRVRKEDTERLETMREAMIPNYKKAVIKEWKNRYIEERAITIPYHILKKTPQV